MSDTNQHSVLSDVRDALAAPKGDAGVDARMLALDSVQRLVEQNERQATNIDALYRQRRDAELACEQTREENRRLFEQLATIEQERDDFEASQARLLHIIECADTPLMRDVLAERDGLKEQLEASQEALNLACDVAIWLSGLPCLRESEAWDTWEGQMRPQLFKALDARTSSPASEPEAS